MQDINKILSKLSPEKRALLEKKLKKNSHSYNSFPLSFAQKRLWFLDQLEPGNTAYNIPVAIRLVGDLDLKVLNDSIDHIVKRHEVLRSKIVSIDDSPMQVIDSNFRVKINEFDLTNILGNAKEEKLKFEVIKEANTKFNLSECPLFKIVLYKLDNDEHILQIVMHHLITDGWSAGLFINELSACYDSFLKHQIPELPELTIQYGDFAKWQLEWSKSENYSSQMHYWKNEFKNLPENLDLPTDKPRPYKRNYKGAIYTSTLPNKLSEEIKSLANTNSTTTFILSLAVLKILLNKFTNENDIAIGTPIANRQRTQIQSLIGFFVNTLVIRNWINSSDSFLEFLNSEKNKVLNAFDNQDIPFENLVEELHPDRNMSRTPLFQVMFSYQNTQDSALKLSNLTIDSFEIENKSSKFDLSFSINDNNSDLLLAIEYDTDIFNSETIKKFANSYIQLFTQIINNPNQLISSLSVLTQNDVKIINSVNDSDFSYPSTENIIELFYRNLHEYKNNVAVRYQSDQITYDELNSRSNQLGNYLLKKGIANESIVTIILDRSIESIVSILAIWKTGAAYLPLLPTLPSERVNTIIHNSGSKFIITNSNSIKKKYEKEIQIIDLYGSSEEINQESTSDLLCNINSKNLAYVISTSGSTGTPKGVMIQHNSLVNLAFGLKEIIYKNEIQFPLKISLNAPFIFDASLQQIVQLCFGHTLFIVPEETRLDGEKLLDFIRINKLDVFDCVPTQLKLLIELGLLDNNEWIPSKFLPGGEPIDQGTWNALAKIERSKSFNMYGPTECTVDSTICEITLESSKPSIGVPIINAKHYVLDSNLNHVPIGVTGQLYIGEDCLSRGYINSPNLTAEKFIPNPYSTQSGDRIYATGDLVRFLNNGNIEYVKRIDDQIKLRGFRIELNEIDSILSKMEIIELCISILVSEDENNSHLVTYYKLKTETENIKSEIKEYLSEKLPKYMIPTYFVELKEIPLLPNGKIDKKALPKPSSIVDEELTDIVEPKTSTEEILVGIFERVLSTESNISVKDNFFEIGGHSLLATKVISRIRDAFNIDLPLNILFEKPDIERIAKSIDEQLMVGGKSEIASIKKVSRDSRIPLSFSQERLWFIDQLNSQNSVYNIPSALRVLGPIDIGAFEESIYEMAIRHEILRTSIITLEGKGYQNIHETPIISLRVEDISNNDENSKHGLIKKRIEDEAKHIFKLSEIPLFQSVLLKCEDEEYVLILNMHHIISDAWSSGIFIEEFTRIYFAKINNKKFVLDKLNIQYADYANWQRKRIKGELLKGELKYWQKQLDGIPPLLELPTDRKRPAVQTFNGQILSFELDSAVVKQIQSFNQENGFTSFMFFITVFMVLLQKYSRQTDLCLGTPIANRNISEIESLIGFFVNTLVIRGRVNNNLSFKDFLRNIRSTSLEAFAHQDIPFEKIVDSLNINRDVSHSPIFQVMFVYQSFKQNKVELPNLSLEQIPFESRTSKFDLSLTIAENQDGSLSCSYEFNSDLFEFPTIEKLAKYYQNVVERIISNPNIQLAKIDLLSNSDKKLLLKQINDTKYDFQPDTIHGLIEKQTQRKPTAIAVQYKSQSITYEELDKRSEHFANYLISIGLQQENIVGVLMEPSLEMMISILGILKAGGAYLPLDPMYPSSRIEYMVNNSKVNFIAYQELFEQIVNFGDHQKIKIDNVLNKNNSIDIYGTKRFIFPSNLAYVIYTSGSTGQPKGVAVTHEGVLNHHYSFDERSKAQDIPKCSLWTSLNFDPSVDEIFHCLCRGGELHIVPAEIRPISIEFFEWMMENRIQNAYIPPMMLDDLALWLNEEKHELYLENLLVGVEPIKLSTLSTIKEKIPGLAVLNGYGPTETTVYSTAFNFEKSSNSNDITPIGKPIINTRIYLLDNHLNLVPEGIPGEVFISTTGIARGYLNKPDATADRFIPNPYSQIEGDRMYRTGDLAKILPDGNLKFIGRVDHQVKIRGFRVELNEIEAKLNLYDKIEKAVTILYSEESAPKKLVAYFQSVRDEKINITELREFLAKDLPDYMIPSLFIEIEAIPITPNGKIDRKSLPKPSKENISTSTKYVEPKTKKEKILAEILKQLLGLDKIGINDNFFELGGDSILAIQLISKAKQEGLQITPLLVFQNQTLAELANIAEEVEIVKAEQGIVRGNAPLTPIQNFFFESEFHNPNQWNQSLLFKIQKDLDVQKLEDTVIKLVTHHDSLRLKIVNEISPQQEFPGEINSKNFEFFDLSESRENNEKSIETICSNSQSSLSIYEGVVFKLVYIRICESEGRLLFIAHHLCVDGISWRLIIEDFQSIYTQLSNNNDITMPSKTTSLKHYTDRLTEYSKSQIVKDQLPYWVDQSKYIEDSLPIDFMQGINNEESGENIFIEFDESATDNLLKKVNQKYNTQINDILLTALVRSYSVWAGKRSIPIKMEHHGREEIFDGVDISRTVGWFTALYPCILQLKKAVEIGESIKTIKEQLRKIPLNGFSYGVIRYLVGDDAIMNSLKEFDKIGITFNYLGQFDNILQKDSLLGIAKEEKGFERDPQNLRSSLIDISGMVSGRKLRLTFNYSANKFKSESINSWAQSYKKELENIISHCIESESKSFTSSDFGLSTLDDNKLNKILSQLNKKKN